MTLKPTEDECLQARARLENERGQTIAGPMEALRQNVRVVKWGTVAIFVAASLTVAVGAFRTILPL